MKLRDLLFLGLLGLTSAAWAASNPTVIAHRGSSGMYPEHTELAYRRAAEQGADFVECDVTITKDLVLVCSHEPWISDVSNVDDSTSGPPHPDYSDRLNTYNMDDDDPDFDWNDKDDVTDYFAIDFTAAELLGLRRKQRLVYRDPLYNWNQTFVPFSRYLGLSRELGFGVYPEVKQGAATNSILASRGVNKTLEQMILEELKDHGYSKESDPCYVQAFERTSITRMREELGTELRLVFLLKRDTKFSDEDLDSYVAMGANGMGIPKEIVVKTTDDKHIDHVDQDLVRRIQSRGLTLHVYTFRNEWQHLPWDYGQDPYLELKHFKDIGVDGFFTDFPGTATRFLDGDDGCKNSAGRAAATAAMVVAAGLLAAVIVS